MQRALLLVSFLFVVVFGFPNNPLTCGPNGFQSPHANPNQDNTLAFTHNLGATPAYAAGQTYTLTVTSQTANINGFIFWAQDALGNRVGTWTPGNNQAVNANGNCVNSATLTSTATLRTSQVTGSWTAPAAGTGSVTFTFVNVQATPTTSLNSFAVSEKVATPTSAAVTPTSAAAAATTRTSAAAAGTTKTSAAATPTSAAAAGTTKTSAAAGTPTSAAAGTPTSAAAGTPTSAAAGTPSSAPVNNLGSGNGGAGAGGNGLSTGAMAGIAVGVAIGGVLLLAMVVPIIYARVKKDDPRVQRMTQRFTRSFQRA